MPDITISPGDIPTAAQWNSNMLHTGAAFNSWTPVVTQGVGVTVTVSEATYFRAGRFIMATAHITATSTGTAATAIVCTLPVAAKTGYTTSSIIGTAHVYDASAATHSSGETTWATSTTVSFRSVQSGGGGQFLGATGASMTAALASGDVIVVQAIYEAASG